MKKGYKFAAVFSALLMSAVLLTACSGSISVTTGSGESSTEISHSDIGNNAANADPNSETEVSQENSSEENSETNSSEQPESSQNTESSVTSEVSEKSEAPSQVSVVSEQPPQESEDDGYYFDDEQIVDDYHTATVFTDNEEFNNLFRTNKIDMNYQKELQDASTISKMRAVTANYAEVWKAEEEKAYKELSNQLDGRHEAEASLDISEQEWKDSIQQVIDEFYADIDPNNSGSEELLSADTAVMNYYKGRTAKLYEQIYQLTGQFNM